MSGPGYAFGSRKVDINALARQGMTAAEQAEIRRTCLDRGFRLALTYSGLRRAYHAVLVVGGTAYEGVASTPMEAWRIALALRDGPAIVSLLTPDTSA